MRVLSLFSGGGLGDFGLELAGMEIVGQIEIDEFCQKILNLRWPDVPKWRDIRQVRGEEILERCGTIDLVSGGFPCQPFSVAGRRRGASDERSLWPEMSRIICEIKPNWVLAENVPGLLSMDSGRVFGGILGDLAESGYGIEWDCIPASAVGAPHQRDRVWIVAYPMREGLEGHGNLRKNEGPIQKARVTVFGPTRESGLRPNEHWSAEPNVGRVAHGVPHRVDRLKGLGNGQVVQVVQWIGEKIMEFENALPEKREGAS